VREDVGPDTWQPAGHTDDFSTAMPAGIYLAATWNPDLGYTEGETIGQEARKRGKDIMLGPGENIMRTPLCGRNFEYLGSKRNSKSPKPVLSTSIPGSVVSLSCIFLSWFRRRGDSTTTIWERSNSFL
jgi:hypothetical protein